MSSLNSLEGLAAPELVVMHNMKLNLILLFLIAPMTLYAGTIDYYVNKADGNQLWGNSTCGYVDPVPSFDANKMLENAFKTVSLDEGKPKKWEILEHKKVKIHGDDYYLIRFIAFEKERIFVFDFNMYNKKWCVKSTA